MPTGARYPVVDVFSVDECHRGESRKLPSTLRVGRLTLKRNETVVRNDTPSRGRLIGHVKAVSDTLTHTQTYLFLIFSPLHVT